MFPMIPSSQRCWGRWRGLGRTPAPVLFAWATPSSAQGFLLSLCSGITPERPHPLEHHPSTPHSFTDQPHLVAIYRRCATPGGPRESLCVCALGPCARDVGTLQPGPPAPPLRLSGPSVCYSECAPKDTWETAEVGGRSPESHVVQGQSPCRWVCGEARGRR